MKQARIDSLMEAVTNTAIGFTVSFVTQLIVFPLFDIHVSLTVNLWIIGIFTAVSVARQYVLRRLFDGRTPWQAVKRLFRPMMDNADKWFDDVP